MVASVNLNFYLDFHFIFVLITRIRKRHFLYTKKKHVQISCIFIHEI